MKSLVDWLRSVYKTGDFIPLHEPRFVGNEHRYVADAIESTFVSSVGEYVTRFENDFSETVGIPHCIAVTNGTAALHLALNALGVAPGDEVITQPLTFVSTCNAISYCGAKPVFVDVDRSTLGMSSQSLRKFLAENTVVKNGVCYNNSTGSCIRACLPVHVFGHPLKADEIKKVCEEFSLFMIEDAAEALGSFDNGLHVGSVGDVATFSFNGNKIITAGGGGMVVTSDDSLATRIRHLSTTAKVPHEWEYRHDLIGYNYRLPNLNAALACGQLENLSKFVASKRNLALGYRKICEKEGLDFFSEPQGSESNYWLNAILFSNREERDEFLTFTNSEKIMTRPVWELMCDLDIYCNCQKADLSNSRWLQERIVNVPSSAVISDL